MAKCKAEVGDTIFHLTLSTEEADLLTNLLYRVSGGGKAREILDDVVDSLIVAADEVIVDLGLQSGHGWSMEGEVTIHDI